MKTITALVGGVVVLMLIVFGGLYVYNKSSPFSTTATSTSTPTGTPGGGTAAGNLPAATTEAASSITAVSAKINGQVMPNKAPTVYWFEYGKTKDLDVILQSQAVGADIPVVAASTTLQGLAPGTTYYYRLIALNENGPVSGNVLTFKTAPQATFSIPVVTTQLPSSFSSNSSTLEGTVNPRGTAATYWFEYGTDTNLVSAVKTTPHKSTGAGTTTASISQAVSGLTGGTTYYYRTVVQNIGGTVKGDIISFKTK